MISIMLVYAAHVFDDNILYFCSKISKKLYIIGNVYANIKSSSEGGQQTTTRDFTCSVSEFTSSTGSIHVFSVREFTGFCRQIWCVDTCLLLVKSRVFPFVKNTCFLHVYSPDCRT